MNPNPNFIDDENPEWTDSDFKNAKRGYEVFTAEELAGLKRTQGQRGKQKSPVKVRVALRLDMQIVDAFKATGKGWQSRMNDALKTVSPI